MTASVAQVLFNSIIPEKYRDYRRDYTDPSTVTTLLTQMARELPPDEYRDILRDVYRLGSNVSYYEGASFSLEDLRTPPIVKAKRDILQKQVQKISEDKSISKEKRNAAIIKLVSDNVDSLKHDMLAEADSRGSGLALQIKSKSRGKVDDLQSLLIGDLLMQDANGKVIPFPMLHGYAEGVDPAEYWSGTHGTRKGIIDEKVSTADSGYWAKKTKQVAHKQVVTEDDCGTLSSIEVGSKDTDNIGAVLAADTDGFKAGTPLTANILKKIKSPNIQVRSPVTCKAKQGLCKKCLGIRETGKFPEIGDNIGMVAAQSLGERATQTALSCLVEGTLVRMSDGTTKKIEDIKVGEYVLGSDRFKQTSPAKVTNTFNQGYQPSHRFSYRGYSCDQISIECTEDHKILSGNFVTMEPVAEYQIGIIIFYGNCVCVDKKDSPYHLWHYDSLGDRLCFDIEVDNQDHLFVLASGIICSNSKHSSGRSSGKSHQFVTGFPLIEQLMDVPSNFTDAAAMATTDGAVDRIEDAPQGGKYIHIGQEKVHVAPEMTISVKVGDRVEAGDLLSDGIPDPSKMVKYKGIGETRRQFVNQLRDATKANRRNVEVLSKAFVDFVKVTDPTIFPNAAPDDIIRYSDVERDWTPREKYYTTSPGSAVGRYLETPVAHYTIGTRITRGVAKTLDSRGIKKIDVHDDPPPFEPTMVPSVRALTHSDDWQERMGGYHLKDSLLDAAGRGMSSTIEGTSYLPGIMKGTTFGDKITTEGVY